MMSDDSDFGNFLAGFVIGGLVGAAAALLLAPQSGEDTRVLLRDKGIELKDRAVETAEDTRVRAEEALEEARIRAEDAMEELRVRTDEVSRLAKERAADLQQRGQGMIDEQRGRIESAIDSGKRAASRAREDINLPHTQDTPPASTGE